MPRDIPESLIKQIQAAESIAIQEHIKANTILINEKYAKVNPFIHVYSWGGLGLFPPMICGLEVKTTSELPEGYMFAVTQSPQTEREAFEEQVQKDTAKKIMEKLKASIKEQSANGLIEEINELCEEYGIELEEEDK